MNGLGLKIACLYVNLVDFHSQKELDCLEVVEFELRAVEAEPEGAAQ